MKAWYAVAIFLDHTNSRENPVRLMMFEMMLESENELIAEADPGLTIE